MPTPDARPAGETALDRAAYLLTAERLSGSYQPDGMGWWMARVAETRTELAAEARAALLAGAPVVWVATNTSGWGYLVVGDARPTWRKNTDGGQWVAPYDYMVLDPPLTPPGTCVRYRLVPAPE